MSQLQIAGGRRWLLWAEEVTNYFPLAATDWDLHAEYVDTGVYSVRNRRYSAEPAQPRMNNFAEEPPPTPEEEEAIYAGTGQPQQMGLF